MSSTRASCHVNAPRASVYRALLDPRAVAAWKVPAGMTSHIHSFEAREGGSFRISTYKEPTGTGKTTAHTDTYYGRFVKVAKNEQTVEVVEFETADPALRGEMTITITLADADGGTDLVAVHDGLPRGVASADNEAGWREALAKLAALVEAEEGVKRSMPEDPVTQMVQLADDAFNRGDLEAFLEFYADDAVMVIEPGRTLRGKSELRRAFEVLLSYRAVARQIKSHVIENGDVALYLSKWSFSGTGPEGPYVREGVGTSVMRRGSDGRWRVFIENPWGATLLA